jgi:glycosyltransferase involved in cell wall biosynthesis
MPALPFVSVVVPTYNRKDWVVQLIESLDKQTYPRDKYELIIVDNGSRDGLCEVLNRFAADGVIRWFPNPLADKVPAAARNFAVRQAKGEIIAFTDSDCVATPAWLAEGVQAFGPGVGIVQGATLPDPNDPRPVLYKTVEVVSEKSYANTCNIFYKKAALEEVGGFSQDFIDFGYPMFGEDIDLACKVKYAGYSLVFSEKTVIYHHIRPQTVMDWLAEPWGAFTFPYIVKKHPTIRRDLLFGHVFLTPLTALFDLMLVGIVLAYSLHPWFLLLAVPFIVMKVREGGRHLTVPMRLVRLAGATVRAFIIFGVLLCGSFRFRSILV